MNKLIKATSIESWWGPFAWCWPTAISQPHQFYCLVQETSLHTSSHKNCICHGIWGDTFLHNLLKQSHGLSWLSSVKATLNQACVDLNVDLKVKLFADVFQHGECLVNTPASPHQLHKHAERIVRRCDIELPHVVQKLESIIWSVLLGAASKKTVVHDFVWNNLATSLHVIQNAECTVQLTSIAETLHNCGICHNVRLHLWGCCFHVLQQRRNPVHCPTLGEGVQDRIVGDGVGLDAMRFHLIIQCHDLVAISEVCE